jgi:hypothetical protein
MKTLELNKMETLQGGSCAISAGSYAATIVICALSGPFGWVAMASIAIASVGLVDGCLA